MSWQTFWFNTTIWQKTQVGVAVVVLLLIFFWIGYGIWKYFYPDTQNTQQNDKGGTI